MPAHIHLLGTSHIAESSLRDVKKTVAELEPTIIAIELDKERLVALLTPELKGSVRLRDIRHVGLQGWLFAALGGWAERKLGSVVGVDPGADMLEAVNLAKKHKIKVALIDQPIRKTLSRLSKELTWRERGRFVIDIIKGIFQRKKLPFNLSSVPDQDLVTQLLEQLRPRYPSIYKTLVHERNVYMTKKLKQLVRMNPDATILAVVGAGHVKGMHKLLSVRATGKLIKP